MVTLLEQIGRPDTQLRYHLPPHTYPQPPTRPDVIMGKVAWKMRHSGANHVLRLEMVQPVGGRWQMALWRTSVVKVR